MDIACISLCEIGMVREKNQDAVFSSVREKCALFAVADGMGGHSEGERASAEVVSALEKWFLNKEEFAEMRTSSMIIELKTVLKEANEKIRNATPKGEVCGCTVTALLIYGDKGILASAGDSRCYEWKRSEKGELIQLSSDDVVGGEGREKNFLTNAVGIKSPFSCRIQMLDLEGKRMFLLCTDGIYKYCSEEVLKTAMWKAEKDRLEIAADVLKSAVAMKGARDNFSAIIISKKR